MIDADLPLETSVAEVLSSLELPEAQRPRLIDCREEDEWQICHLDGAELMPLSRFAEATEGRFTDSERPVVVYCHHGMRSLRAALWLRQKGVPQAQSMTGGIEAWALEADPAMARY